MIQSLELQNFQSHKKTSIQFSQGINSIVGISDSGKTALLRGLNWVINNRPLGLSFVSHWNRDKDGEPVKSTFVRVINDKGIIERRKGKIKKIDHTEKFNGYVLDSDKYLEAVGTSVPDEVAKMFNLDEVNFQGQFDPSFLLSNSAGEVARFFNSTIRLDLIDRILSKADSKRLETNKDKKKLEVEQETINKEIEKFDWLDDAEQLANRIEKIDLRIIESRNIYSLLEEQISEHQKYLEDISIQEVILSAEPIVNRIMAIQESLEQKTERLERLQNLYGSYIEQNNIIGSADFSLSEKIITQIDTVNEKIRNKEELLESLKESIEDYKEQGLNISEYGRLIKELNKQLPEKCPTCGKKMSEDDCK